MAAFQSFEHQPFTLDSSSLLLPNSPFAINDQMSSLLEEPKNANSVPVFPQFYRPENQLQNLDQSAKVSINNWDNSVVSVPNKNNMDCSSIVTDEHEATQTVATKRACKQGSSANSAHSKDKSLEFKEKRRKKMKNGDQEKKAKKEKKPAEEAPAGYILVKARRGQATDSHSLAERVRRERLRERMKMLQALVPGCDKVTGKALMLDEIIKYVKSLQNQVEFLSTKLASVDPLSYDFGVNSGSFMVRPEQELINLNHYGPLENSASSLLFSQAQNPSVLPQVVRNLIEQKKEAKASIYPKIGMHQFKCRWGSDDSGWKRTYHKFHGPKQ